MKGSDTIRHMIIRKTTKEDIPSVMSVYEQARAFMKNTGNPTQWGDHYPPKEFIEDDVEQKRGYVVVSDNNEIVGAFMFYVGKDPTYEIIENGNWLNDDTYGVIHRIAGSGKEKGILKEAVRYCLDICGNIRIDTYKDNKVMQNALEKLGFIRCGTIYLENGDPRIAYQLVSNLT